MKGAIAFPNLGPTSKAKEKRPGDEVEHFQNSRIVQSDSNRTSVDAHRDIETFRFEDEIWLKLFSPIVKK